MVWKRRRSERATTSAGTFFSIAATIIASAFDKLSRSTSKPGQAAGRRHATKTDAADGLGAPSPCRYSVTTRTDPEKPSLRSRRHGSAPQRQPAPHSASSASRKGPRIVARDRNKPTSRSAPSDGRAPPSKRAERHPAERLWLRGSSPDSRCQTAVGPADGESRFPASGQPGGSLRRSPWYWRTPSVPDAAPSSQTFRGPPVRRPSRGGSARPIGGSELHRRPAVSMAILELESRTPSIAAKSFPRWPRARLQRETLSDWRRMFSKKSIIARAVSPSRVGVTLLRWLPDRPSRRPAAVPPSPPIASGLVPNRGGESSLHREAERRRMRPAVPPSRDSTSRPSVARSGSDG